MAKQASRPAQGRRRSCLPPVVLDLGGHAGGDGSGIAVLIALLQQHLYIFPGGIGPGFGHFSGFAVASGQGGLQLPHGPGVGVESLYGLPMGGIGFLVVIGDGLGGAGGHRVDLAHAHGRPSCPWRVANTRSVRTIST
uniref:Uncharacterized protein n=1 Tax=Magnetospirillum gryphiswaldense TaxID=55518 RepID=A0A9P1JDY3_9PROT|nr:hypothetical protein MGR_P0005 [Magnetospirillum gryphiswaldense MSR-1]